MLLRSQAAAAWALEGGCGAQIAPARTCRLLFQRPNQPDCWDKKVREGRHRVVDKGVLPGSCGSHLSSPALPAPPMSAVPRLPSQLTLVSMHSAYVLNCIFNILRNCCAPQPKPSSHACIVRQPNHSVRSWQLPCTTTQDACYNWFKRYQGRCGVILSAIVLLQCSEAWF